MKNEKFEAFIKEGMQSYKKASQVAALFRSEIEKNLRTIIEQRDDWGPFKKLEMKTPQSSKYWTEYPHINSNVQGELNNEKLTIRLGVNWFRNDTEYPYYSILFYNSDMYLDSMQVFSWKEEFYYENDLNFDPDPNDFDLARDFNLLIDEFVRFLKTLVA